MSMQARLSALITAIGGDIKTLLAAQGNLAALNTTAKGSLVQALNELQDEIAALSAAAGAQILDTAAAGDTAHTWSADKLVSALAALKSEILGGASAAYDTLQELAAELQDSDSAIANLLTAVGNRVSFADVQTLTAPQQAQACANIGVGDPETDLAALYAAAKA